MCCCPGEEEALPLAAGIGNPLPLQQVDEGQGTVIVAVEDGGLFLAALRHLQEVVILAGEAQDTSKIQHAILRLLAAKSRSIFMVGDEDQSIYGFRAAWPQALLEFEQVFPGAKVLKLETNYRSTRAIVEKADAPGASRRAAS